MINLERAWRKRIESLLRQRHHDTGSVLKPVRHPDGSLERGGDMLDNGKPEARAARGAAAVLVNPVETLEDLVAQSGRYADARIEDFDFISDGPAR